MHLLIFETYCQFIYTCSYAIKTLRSQNIQGLLVHSYCTVNRALLQENQPISISDQSTCSRICVGTGRLTVKDGFQNLRRNCRHWNYMARISNAQRLKIPQQHSFYLLLFSCSVADQVRTSSDSFGIFVAYLKAKNHMSENTPCIQSIRNEASQRQAATFTRHVLGYKMVMLRFRINAMSVWPLFAMPLFLWYDLVWRWVITLGST